DRGAVCMPALEGMRTRTTGRVDIFPGVPHPCGKIEYRPSDHPTVSRAFAASAAGGVWHEKTGFRYRKPVSSLSENLLRKGSNAYVRFAFALLAELHGPVYESEQRVILADTDVLAGVVDRTALTDDDVAGLCELTAEQLDAE